MPKSDKKLNLSEINYLLEKTDILVKRTKKEAKKEKKGCGKCESPLLYAAGLCKEHYLELRRQREDARKGAIWKSTDGIWRINDENGKIKLYHRYIVEQEIGRELRRDEVVKFLDGNKDNLDISNLSISGLSLKDVTCPHCGEPMIKGD